MYHRNKTVILYPLLFTPFEHFAKIENTRIQIAWAAEQRVLLNYIKLVVLTIIVSIAKPVISIILISLSDDAVTARILGLAIAEVAGYAGLLVHAQNWWGKQWRKRKTKDGNHCRMQVTKTFTQWRIRPWSSIQERRCNCKTLDFSQ